MSVCLTLIYIVMVVLSLVYFVGLRYDTGTEVLLPLFEIGIKFICCELLRIQQKFIVVYKILYHVYCLQNCLYLV